MVLVLFLCSGSLFKSEKILKNKIKKAGNIYCHRGGILCNGDETFMKGQADDAKLFLAAKKYCSQIRKCFFDVVLSKKGQENLGNILSERFPGMNIQVLKPTGWFLAVYDCQSNYEKQDAKIMNHIEKDLSENNIIRGNYLISCQENHDEQFWFRGKIILKEDEKNREDGFKNVFEARYQVPYSDVQWNLQGENIPKAKNKKSEIVGEPDILLTPKRLATLISGGEFKVMYDSPAQKGGVLEGWKKTGLQMEIEMQTMQSDFLVMKYKMELRNRSTNAGSNTLKLHNLESEIHLMLKRPTLLGTIDLSQEDEAGSFIPGFNSIPIIGPLFKLDIKQNAHMKLWVWALVDYFNPKEPEKMPEWPKIF